MSAAVIAKRTADAALVRDPYAAAPDEITAIVPSVAPLESPISVGSASGLRKIPCAIAPAIPKPAPITAAPSARGKRICQTVVASVPEWWVNKCHKDVWICTMPVRSETAKSARATVLKKI